MNLIHVSMSDLTCHPHGDNDRCRELHTPCPPGYNNWHEWARIMGETKEQVRCPKCGLFTIWKPKAVAREINKRDRAEARKAIKMYDKMWDDREKARKADDE